jgi:hypothetical protein
MHHTTSPTSTPAASPTNHNTTQAERSRRASINKANALSDAVTLADVAMERVRHYWRKKKTGHGKKEWMMPPDVANLVTQALTVSRAHLLDYRDQVNQEGHGKQEAAPGATITADTILHDLHPGITLSGERLAEPHEPLEKMKAVLSLLMASQNEETGEFLIQAEQVSWAISLLSELLDEAEQRSTGYQAHCYDLYREAQNRLQHHAVAGRYLGHEATCESSKGGRK